MSRIKACGGYAGASRSGCAIVAAPVSPRVPLIAASLGMKRPAVVVVSLCPSSVVCCSLVRCRERQNVWSMLGRCWCGANQCTDKGRRNRDFGCLTFHLISPCPLPQLGRHGGFRLSDLA